MHFDVMEEFMASWKSGCLCQRIRTHLSTTIHFYQENGANCDFFSWNHFREGSTFFKVDFTNFSRKKRKYEWRTGAKEVIRFSAPADKKKEKNVWVIFKRICRWHIEEQTCLSIPGKSTSVWGFFFSIAVIVATLLGLEDLWR